MITLHYESRFGLARGAVYVKGQPHLYAEGYDSDSSLNLLGVRSVARLKTRSGGVAFLTLADGAEAVLDAPQEALAKLSEGTAVEIEIIAEARLSKLARARLIGPGEGDPRRVSPLLTLKDRLLHQARACFGDQPLTTDDDSDALDTAEEAALNPSGPLPEGGYLSVERTQALIACDVDAAGGEGMAAAKNFAKTCNERAVFDVARRLRLSGLAGLVVIDLIGRRHDGERLRGLLTAGFGAEADRIIIAPIGKFGTLEFARPWGACPLMDADKALRTGHRLLREAAQHAADAPGRRLTLRAPHSVLDKVRPLLAGSYDPLTPMLSLEAGDKPEVTVL